MNIGLIITALEQAGVYSVMALGIYITYKILDFPDLTVDGSFPLGAAITAALLTRGIDPFLSMLLSFLAGCAAGFCTGFLHVRLKVRDLLAGMIMMTALYSVNFLIAGKANVPITREMNTLFSGPAVESLFGEGGALAFLGTFRKILVLLLLLLLLKYALDFFLRTRLGYLLRAEGDNQNLVSTLAVDGGRMKIFGLAIANGLVSLSGSLNCMYSRAFNLTDGTGKMVIGLAVVIIGINVFGRIPKIAPTTAVLCGSVVYNFCLALALKNVDPNIKNLVFAVLFLLVLQLGRIKGRSQRGGKQNDTRVAERK